MEFTLEEIIESFDRLLPDAQSEEVEKLTLTEEFAKYTTTYESLEELRLQMAGGVSREMALSLEELAPGALPERIPAKSFTLIPSGTNLKFSLEAIGLGKLAAVGAIIAAIFAALYKLAKWVIALLRGTKGINETAMKETAQARTAAETVNETVNKVTTTTPLVGFDPQEIDKLRHQIFLDPFKAKITKAMFLLVFDQQPLFSKLYSTICANLMSGKGSMFAATEASIRRFDGKLNDFIKRSEADATTAETQMAELFDQPLLPVLYGFADVGLLTPMPQFQVRPVSSVGRSLQTVLHEQYLTTLVAATDLLIGPTTTLMLDDAACAKKAETVPYFTTQMYSNELGLKRLEGLIEWFGGNVVIPDDTDVQLSRIESALTDLRKTVTSFEQVAKKDPNAQLLAPALVNHLNSFQQDLRFLSRFVCGVRSLQRELATFGRMMTTAETACLNYLKSLMEQPAQAELAELVAKKRKEHQDVLKRFKGFLA